MTKFSDFLCITLHLLNTDMIKHLHIYIYIYIRVCDIVHTYYYDLISLKHTLSLCVIILFVIINCGLDKTFDLKCTLHAKDQMVHMSPEYGVDWVFWNPR